MDNNEDKLRDYLKRVTTDLRQTRRRLAEFETREHEPVAIVATACRMPGGARTPEDLWKLVTEGTDTVAAMPTDRGWDLDALYDPDPDRTGTSYVREGAFLYDAAEFDAAFFGISPREALAMDPQQRLLLETTWEVFERAGIDPNTLRGSSTGVFIGSSNQGYALDGSNAPDDVEGHLLTGGSAAVLSGRLSYSFGLEGPAVSLDTMCSSSLVALHLAVQALRTGECSMAVTGGATVMATTRNFVEFSRQRGLAVDGRCKPFAEGADGTGWGEGVGVLLLERLSDARRNNHQVLAVVRGTAINQDGASNGLTAPNGPSQQRVIRAALANAGLSTTDVDVIEAHGTGTKLGDPIEAQALLAVYGQDRPADRPLWLGSVKSNIGHTQAASGVAAVIKTVESLRHGLLPKSLHVDEPTSHVDWSAGPLTLLTEAVDWPETGRPRRAGVSSFGGSGTNAHVIIEQAPQDEAPQEAPAQPAAPAEPAAPAALPWLLSARSDTALKAQAEQFAARIETGGLAAVDVAHSLATGRAALEERAVVVGTDRDELLTALRATAHGDQPATVARGLAENPGEDIDSVFVFPGQGAQWVGMAVELLDSSPVFAARFGECAAALDAFVDWSLVDVVRGVEGAAGFERVDVVQPVLWAVMVSLAALWESFGVRPAAVVGHSQGEIAAAVVSGALSLADGARVVALRSRAIIALAGRGGMVSVALPREQAQELIAGWDGRVSVAAVNGPTSVVVSGDADALDELMELAAVREIRVRRVEVDYASHSAHVESIRDELLEVLGPVVARVPVVPFFSTVTGEWVESAVTDAGYWYTNLRRTVELESAVRELVSAGHGAFLEMSPHPVLTVPVAETVEAAGADVLVTGTLRRGQGGLARFYTSLGEAWVRGVGVDWSPVFEGLAPRRVELPTYAFQRQRYWLELPKTSAGVVDPVGERFWKTVEDGDLEEFARTLGLNDPSVLGEVVPALSSWHRGRQDRSTLDSWRYRITWRPKPAATPATAALDGTWLVIVPETHQDDTIVQAVSRLLVEAGAATVPLVMSETDLDRAAVAEQLTDIVAADTSTPVRGVVSLLSLDERPAPGHDGPTVGLTQSLSLVQGLLDAGTDTRLWLLTTESATTGVGGDTVQHPLQAAVWGLGRVLALEQPKLWGGLIDLPAHLDPRTGAALVATLAAAGDEDQIALRPSGTYIRRLVRAPLSGRPGARTWRTSGSALVTGGTGGLGGHAARLLARNGAEHLVLTSRHGLDAPGAAELRDELTALGCRVTIAACDVADRDALTRLVQQVEADGPAIRSVVHTAGVGMLAPLADTDMDFFAEGLRAKLLGAANLDAVFDHDRLDAFVLYSSVAGTWGSGDHGAYSASNAYVDALADHRRARGLTGTSLAWGIWSPEGGGMAVNIVREQLRWRGIPFMDPQLAVDGLQQALDHDDTFLAVADIDWERFVPVFTAAHPRPLLHEVPEVAEAMKADEAVVGHADSRADTLRAELAGMSAAERDRALSELVRSEVAGVLGFADSAEIAVTRAFRDMGFDSLTAVELRNRLNSATGLGLPATIVFDHPNVRDLVRLLRTRLAPEDTAADSLPAAVTPAAAAPDDEPIAIVSMGCRFPGGVTSPDELWRLVQDETDAVSLLPTDRGWDVDNLYDPDPDRAGTTYTREGGFLHDAADFDAAFFEISPREATAMDPQQRLLLETAWEVLERAGIAPDSLHGSPTGVFVGASHQGYGSRSQAPEGFEGHLITGTVTSIASGRISYTLGLEGPAVTMDTGCSSALVALHMAVQSLRSGECSLALTGGAAVMGEPIGLVGFSRQRGLAADGRCKPFSADADGMGMAEGVGMVLLERLSDARRHGHPVLAVVRGTAINQDGASNGLTAPNGLSQQRVIQAALANAGLTTADVDVVEAHGTGTKLGDPIEAQALLATYGQDRPAGRPLWLGSVKSNIGHAQAASGMAGVIKMVQAIRYGTMPKSLHADEVSPFVDWTAGAVEVLSQARPWDELGRPRRAGVSSFGVSGTNAHIIIEQPEPEAAPRPAPTADDPVLPWLVTARSDTALKAQAGRLASAIETGGLDAVDVAHSLATGRAALEERAVVVGTDRDQLLTALTSLTDGEATPALVRGTTHNPGEDIDSVFVFPGQGAQWVGMAVELLDSSPVFAARFGECAVALDAFVDWSLVDVVRGVEGAAGFERVDVVQPVLWAVMVSLAALWESFGVRPAAVVGHSQGEIAAAVVSGALSLADGARVVALRSRAIIALAGRGGMVSVALPREQAQELIAGWDGRVSVAAVNGPTSVVVSGDADALDELMELAAVREIRVRRVEVDYASHSAHVESIRDELLEVLGPVVARVPVVPFFSTVTGEWVESAVTDAGYWYTNLRRTVELESAVRELVSAGHGAFLEMSPHPVLTVPVAETVEAAGADVLVTGTLRRGQGGLARFYTSLGEAWVRGVGVDWSPVFEGLAPRRVELPTYAFQRRRYWLELPEQAGPLADPITFGGIDLADDSFWASVEDGDVETLAQTLGLDDAQSLGEVVPALSSWRRSRQELSTLDSWRYRITWRPKPERGTFAAALDGTWLLVVPEGHQDSELVRGVTKAVGERAAGLRTLVIGAREAERERLADLLREEAAHQPVRGVLSLLALDERPWADESVLPTGLVLMTTLLQALGDASLDAPLWCATRGAVSVHRNDRLEHPLQAMSWGLGRIASLEYPQRWGGLIDLPETVDERAGRRLAAALSGHLDEDHIALRPSGLFARRLVRAGDGPRPGGPAWTPSGTVLVTGATGGLGRHISRWLARSGAEHLVLVSRRGPEAPGAAELVAELAELGTPASVVACDVADREAVCRLVDDLPGGGTLTAVVHTAGIIDDGVIDALTPQRAYGVLRPKADAALALHEATRHLDLSAFVLFSSMAGTLGGSGQGSYAAANAFLDAFAARRRADGLPTTSVAWGTWAGGGMVSEEAAERLRRDGVPPMDPELAVSALQKALDQDEEFLVVADVDWKLITARAFAALREFPEARRAAAAGEHAEKDTTAKDGPPLVARLRGLAPAERRAALLLEVRRQAAAVLGHTDLEAVPEDRAIHGLDSLTAVELRNRFAEATGLRLPVTMAFDHPSAAALTAYLDAELFGDDSAAAADGLPALPHTAVDDDPIVIVGMGCRFPGGVRSPEELWRLVADGTDAIAPFPDNRGWDVESLYDPDPDKPGHSYARHGGFLYDADQFDPAFFGISPREAVAVDPQHRLLLETSWEAFERAGIDPARVRGTQAGVFIGSNYNDYGSRARRAPDGLEGYLATGSASSVASGRIAYTFGLEGPAVTVDTACSSSLVALHLAVQALRSGECELALAGGVTVISTPDTFIEFSRQRALSPDGRCKAFSADADGAGWAEGVGLLLLERLSDARRGGHTVLATIAGTAVNQDGASNGLTAPNGPAQQRVIRQALASAGLTPSEVDAVEAHGTGTRLGDPIEAQALLAVYGQDRPAERPLWLGALKSNIGHTQAASGVAGIIKMVMAMRHGVLPRTLHAENPSPHIDWSSGAVRLLDQERAWAPGEGPRRAGVSAFGVSGTNAHVILQEPEPQPAPAPESAPESGAGSGSGSGRVAGTAALPAGRLPSAGNDADAADTPAAPASASASASASAAPVVPWLLSARGTAALREQAARLLGHLAPPHSASPADIALSLATSRAAFEDRAAIVAGDLGSFTEALTALAEGRQHPRLTVERARSGKVAFLFSGQGAQQPETGRRLYAAHDAFADALDAVCAHMDTHLERPLRDVLFAPAGTPEAALLDQTAYTQAGLFAVEVALFRLVESLGLKPDAVLGHSAGEIAAAHVAGMLSLQDACLLVATRGRLMQALPAGGAMISVQASEEEVLALLAGHEGKAAIAALNGPLATVVSGDQDAVTAVADALAAQGRKTRRLNVSHAFHSPRMDAMLDEFAALTAHLDHRPPTLPVVSAVTGRPLGEHETEPAHWVRQVREAVRFHDGVRTLEDQGITTYVEIGPGGVLTAMAGDCVTGEAALVPLLRRDTDETESLTTALARLHTRGHAPDWAALLAPLGARRTDLPTYPFQRSRYWLEATTGTRDVARAGLEAAGHPLLDIAVPLAGSDGVLLTGTVSVERQPWLRDHALGDVVLFPGTAFLELALQACERAGAAQIADLTLQAPLVLPATGAVQLQVTVAPSDGSGTRTLSVHARPGGADDATARPWVRHAEGTLSDENPGRPGHLDTAVWPPAGAEPLDVSGLYTRIAENGFAYGPAFRGLRAAWRLGEEVYAEIVPQDGAPLERAEDFTVHPALLDAALHTVALAADAEGPTLLPFTFTGVSVTAAGPAALRVRLAPQGEHRYAVQVADATGAPVAEVAGLVLRPLDSSRLTPSAGAGDLYRVRWVPAETHSATAPAAVLAGAGDTLAAWADAHAGRVTRHDSLEALRAAVAAGLPMPQTVVAALPATADAADRADAVRQTTHRALELAGAWLREEIFAPARLVFATRHAVATTAADAAATDPAQAAVWGLIRAAKAENPGRFGLLDHDGSAACLDLLPAALAGGEPETALRGTAALAPRLTRAQDVPAQNVTGLAGWGTVLLTGASGVLARQVARHLVTAHEVRSLLLVSRRGADAEGMDALTEELRGHGAEVTLAACDVADRDALAALLAAVPADRPLTAVVHTAGVLDDGIVEALTPERLDTVLRAKADAALHLDELTRDSGLVAFVLFSSLAGTFGGVGQGNYSAANAFLDALAARRSAEGRPAQSLAWGLWAERSGMTGKLGEADLRRVERGGVQPMDSPDALALLDAALRAPDAFLAPAALDPAALRALGAEVPHLLRDLLTPRTPRVARAGHPAAAGTAPESGDGLRERLAALPEHEHSNAVLDTVLAQAALVLGYDTPDTIDPEQGFLQLGYDSLTAVELRNRLGSLTGVRLPATLLFDYPTPTGLADHLLTKMAPAPAPAPGTTPAAGGSVLERLDQMEGEFPQLPADAALHDGLRSRLQRLLDQLDAAAPSVREAAGAGHPDEVSDDELRRFLESELGGA
ncbi:SDR family NAD(P)-dependent oxidoreductase [Streptomyces sp. NBC_01136]|uniref:type I polyketide synthase n=1 Tax=Streptomyces sp. NBC_01136 TaxID=2903754 RepID=UPI0038705885|nr:SDR family NAD(P)-dependent oxidoreductase [Streptomyces sp. NBC_01136]WST81127.1 SDR family NAD(P)-dependent oxidoreductase [Streptomyces sp. NBC_01136]